VIPAGVDCLIYLAMNGNTDNNWCPLGSSATGKHLIAYDNANYGAAIMPSGGSGTPENFAGVLFAPGDGLVRFRRVSGIWKAAATGCAEGDGDGGIGSASISFDTLLANLAPGNPFYSAAGNYIKAIKITKGTSTPDSAYETTYNGGPL